MASKFGTKGFLSAMIAMQMVLAPSLFADGDAAERAGVDVKKSARSVKRDVKKAGRKLTGQDSKVEDAKDAVKDAGKNTKDEVNYQANKVKRRVK